MIFDNSHFVSLMFLDSLFFWIIWSKLFEFIESSYVCLPWWTNGLSIVISSAWQMTMGITEQMIDVVPFGHPERMPEANFIQFKVFIFIIDIFHDIWPWHCLWMWGSSKSFPNKITNWTGLLRTWKNKRD